MIQDYTETEIDVTSTGAVPLGFVQAHKYGGSVRAVEVVAESTVDDAEWNVELDGNDLFGSDASVAASGEAETFTPDQNRSASGDTVSLAVDVNTATSGSAGTMDIGVALDASE